MRNLVSWIALFVLLACVAHAPSGHPSGFPRPVDPTLESAPGPASPSLRAADDPAQPSLALDQVASLEGEDDDDDDRPAHGRPPASRPLPRPAILASPARITTPPRASISKTRLRC